MTRESFGAQKAPANVFERIVAHERSEDLRRPGALRARVPYVFDGMPLYEPASEPWAHESADVPELRATPPIELRTPKLHATPSDPERAMPSQPRASKEHVVPPGPALRVAAAPDVASSGRPMVEAHGIMPEHRAESVVRAAQRERGISSVQRSESITLESGAAEKATGRRSEPPAPSPRAVPRESALRSRSGLRAVSLPPVIAPTPEPVIEIHIGRIDVRAPSASSTPPPAPRGGVSVPDRLGPYLGRRTRGARS